MITDAATRMPVLELSIGDYVLAGGEVATMVMIEAITRLIPGVLGNPDSAGEDSFSGELTGLLEAPSYTRPPVYRGIAVPAVLTSGDHGAVAAYRRAESLRRTGAEPTRPAGPADRRLIRCVSRFRGSVWHNGAVAICRPRQSYRGDHPGAL